MENQEKFMEMMQDLVALAKMNQRRVTKEVIHDYLKNLKLTEKQLKYVYEYLQSENIRVEGCEEEISKEKNAASSEKTIESLYLSMYLQEVEQTGSSNQISEDMYRRAAQGDEEAKNHVIQQKLSRVTQIAAGFLNQGIAQNDLIQEGNLGLLLAVNELQEHENEEDQFLDEAIEKSMLLALDMYKEEKRDNHGLMKRAEKLKDEMEKLEEDLQDKMTSDDIAAFTGMELDEIQNILRMTGEDL